MPESPDARDKVQTLTDKILEVVNESQGIKEVDLALKVMSWDLNCKVTDISSSIAYLVATAQVVEIEYVLPKLDYRNKSFYLPMGSVIRILA